MKALSLWQPWASLWAIDSKRYETRHWPILYRGPLAIHAAKKLCTDIDEALRAILEDEFGGHWAVDLPRGAIIATCELVDCLPTATLIMIKPEERAQGNFTPGRYAYEAQNKQMLKAPIPFRGMQGLFTVPDELLGAEPPPAPQGTLL